MPSLLPVRVRPRVATLLALTLTASLLGTVFAPQPAGARPTHYVEMSDGVLIAVNVQVPEHCTEERPCPTVLEMAGYDNGSDDGRTPVGDLADLTGLDDLPFQEGSRAAHSVFFEDDYVTIQASLRGTGCSTGEFDLFGWRSALDGRELIDGWIAQQPWSDGQVAIFGHSYSGLTGTLIAATRPRHLDAITVSGLIDDLYRGIVYPGGVTNYGFPLLWTGAVRPVYDYGGGVGGGLFPEPDEQCAANQAQRSRTVLHEPLIHGLEDTDSEWYRSRSLVTYIDRIAVPIHITGAYQDEQTGPRGPAHLFERLPEGVSRRLVLTNGNHGTQVAEDIRQDRLAWVDYWLRGANRHDGVEAPLPRRFGPRGTPTATSRVLLGYQDDGTVDGIVDAERFPAEFTDWTELYFTAGGELTPDREGIEPDDASWAHGSKRQSYSHAVDRDAGGELTAPTGPDELEFAYAFERDTVVSGPIAATLRVSSSAPDTELFVQLIDRAPSGELLYLQRGLLRASHRAVIEDLSDATADGRIYRPFRPHSNPTPVEPGAPVDYLVEIFPVGHVFRAGHELVVKVHAPPANDNDYAYIPKTAPALNTLHIDPEAPSHLLLPVIPTENVRDLGPAPEPCSFHRVRCVQP
jgi:uncharacterized protein